jgi:hypothetical protein
MMKVFRKSVFYIGILYFILSAVKWILGEPENTLVQSFWDAVPMTYVHYGIPLCIVAVVFPHILKAVFKNSVDKFEEFFSSALLADVFIVYMFKGIISNVVYCTNFVIVVFIALFGTFVYKKEYVYLKSGEYKDAVKGVMVGIIAFIFSRLIYYPNELYLNNVDEFLNSYSGFFVTLLLGGVIAVLIMLLCVISMPNAWIKIANLFIIGTTIMGYVQATFLNGKLNSMNGAEQTWSMASIISNLVIWLIVIGAIMVLGYRMEVVEKITKALCVYICLIQAATLGYMVITTDVSRNDTLAALTTEGATEISDGDNILVFILDMFDSSMFQEIIEEDFGFVEPLSDFTFYRNSTSQTGHTYTAIPYLLTGTEWKSGLDVPEYMEYAYSNSKFLQDIRDSGFDLGVFTTAKYVDDNELGIISNYKEDVKTSSNVGETLNVMWRASMYNVSPFIMKERYSYYSSDITSMVDTAGIWNIDNDIPFYNDLIREGLSINTNINNAFRFYHMRGDHEPGYLSEDLQYESTGRAVSLKSQAKGCLKIVYEYLEQLKALGKYDDATIIITADHGNVVTYDEENNRPNITSMPIMLVKLPNENNSSMLISNVPISQKVVIGVVNNAIGKEEYDIEAGESERKFVDIIEDYYMIQYEIGADANNIDDWEAISIEYK